MKKLYKLLGILMAAMVLMLSLSACSSSEPDPNSGVYSGVSAELMGVSMELVDILEDEIVIELKDGGKAIFRYEGDSYKMKWSMDGSSFQASGGGATLNGTLSDGTMVLEDVQGSGLSITLHRL